MESSPCSLLPLFSPSPPLSSFSFPYSLPSVHPLHNDDIDDLRNLSLSSSDVTCSSFLFFPVKRNSQSASTAAVFPYELPSRPPPSLSMTRHSSNSFIWPSISSSHTSSSVSSPPETLRSINLLSCPSSHHPTSPNHHYNHVRLSNLREQHRTSGLSSFTTNTSSRLSSYFPSDLSLSLSSSDAPIPLLPRHRSLPSSSSRRRCRHSPSRHFHSSSSLKFDHHSSAYQQRHHCSNSFLQQFESSSSFSSNLSLPLSTPSRLSLVRSDPSSLIAESEMVEWLTLRLSHLKPSNVKRKRRENFHENPFPVDSPDYFSYYASSYSDGTFSSSSSPPPSVPETSLTNFQPTLLLTLGSSTRPTAVAETNRSSILLSSIKIESRPSLPPPPSPLAAVASPLPLGLSSASSSSICSSSSLTTSNRGDENDEINSHDEMLFSDKTSSFLQRASSFMSASLSSSSLSSSLIVSDSPPPPLLSFPPLDSFLFSSFSFPSSSFHPCANFIEDDEGEDNAAIAAAIGKLGLNGEYHSLPSVSSICAATSMSTSTIVEQPPFGNTCGTRTPTMTGRNNIFYNSTNESIEKNLPEDSRHNCHTSSSSYVLTSSSLLPSCCSFAEKADWIALCSSTRPMIIPNLFPSSSSISSPVVGYSSVSSSGSDSSSPCSLKFRNEQVCVKSRHQPNDENDDVDGDGDESNKEEDNIIHDNNDNQNNKMNGNENPIIIDENQTSTTSSSFHQSLFIDSFPTEENWKLLIDAAYLPFSSSTDDVVTPRFHHQQTHQHPPPSILDLNYSFLTATESSQIQSSKGFTSSSSSPSMSSLGLRGESLPMTFGFLRDHQSHCHRLESRDDNKGKGYQQQEEEEDRHGGGDEIMKFSSFSKSEHSNLNSGPKPPSPPRVQLSFTVLPSSHHVNYDKSSAVESTAHSFLHDEMIFKLNEVKEEEQQKTPQSSHLPLKIQNDGNDDDELCQSIKINQSQLNDDEDQKGFRSYYHNSTRMKDIMNVREYQTSSSSLTSDLFIASSHSVSDEFSCIYGSSPSSSNSSSSSHDSLSLGSCHSSSFIISSHFNPTSVPSSLSTSSSPVPFSPLSPSPPGAADCPDSKAIKLIQFLSTFSSPSLYPSRPTSSGISSQRRRRNVRRRRYHEGGSGNILNDKNLNISIQSSSIQSSLFLIKFSCPSSSSFDSASSVLQVYQSSNEDALRFDHPDHLYHHHHSSLSKNVSSYRLCRALEKAATAAASHKYSEDEGKNFSKVFEIHCPSFPVSEMDLKKVTAISTNEFFSHINDGSSLEKQIITKNDSYNLRCFCSTSLSSLLADPLELIVSSKSHNAERERRERSSVTLRKLKNLKSEFNEKTKGGGKGGRSPSGCCFFDSSHLPLNSTDIFSSPFSSSSHITSSSYFLNRDDIEFVTDNDITTSALHRINKGNCEEREEEEEEEKKKEFWSFFLAGSEDDSVSVSLSDLETKNTKSVSDQQQTPKAAAAAVSSLVIESETSTAVTTPEKVTRVISRRRSTSTVKSGSKKSGGTNISADMIESQSRNVEVGATSITTSTSFSISVSPTSSTTNPTSISSSPTSSPSPILSSFFISSSPPPCPSTSSPPSIFIFSSFTSSPLEHPDRNSVSSSFICCNNTSTSSSLSTSSSVLSKIFSSSELGCAKSTAYLFATAAPLISFPSKCVVGSSSSLTLPPLPSFPEEWASMDCSVSIIKKPLFLSHKERVVQLEEDETMCCNSLEEENKSKREEMSKISYLMEELKSNPPLKEIQHIDCIAAAKRFASFDENSIKRRQLIGNTDEREDLIKVIPTDDDSTYAATTVGIMSSNASSLTPQSSTYSCLSSTSLSSSSISSLHLSSTSAAPLSFSSSVTADSSSLSSPTFCSKTSSSNSSLSSSANVLSIISSPSLSSLSTHPSLQTSIISSHDESSHSEITKNSCRSNDCKIAAPVVDSCCPSVTAFSRRCLSFVTSYDIEFELVDSLVPEHEESQFSNSFKEPSSFSEASDFCSSSSQSTAAASAISRSTKFLESTETSLASVVTTVEESLPKYRRRSKQEMLLQRMWQYEGFRRLTRRGTSKGTNVWRRDDKANDNSSRRKNVNDVNDIINSDDDDDDQRVKCNDKEKIKENKLVSSIDENDGKEMMMKEKNKYSSSSISLRDPTVIFALSSDMRHSSSSCLRKSQPKENDDNEEETLKKPRDAKQKEEECPSDDNNDDENRKNGDKGDDGSEINLSNIEIVSISSSSASRRKRKSALLECSSHESNEFPNSWKVLGPKHLRSSDDNFSVGIQRGCRSMRDGEGGIGSICNRRQSLRNSNAVVDLNECTTTTSSSSTEIMNNGCDDMVSIRKDKELSLFEVSGDSFRLKRADGSDITDSNDFTGGDSRSFSNRLSISHSTNCDEKCEGREMGDGRLDCSSNISNASNASGSSTSSDNCSRIDHYRTRNVGKKEEDNILESTKARTVWLRRSARHQKTQLDGKAFEGEFGSSLCLVAVNDDPQTRSGRINLSPYPPSGCCDGKNNKMARGSSRRSSDGTSSTTNSNENSISGRKSSRNRSRNNSNWNTDTCNSSCCCCVLKDDNSSTCDSSGLRRGNDCGATHVVSETVSRISPSTLQLNERNKRKEKGFENGSSEVSGLVGFSSRYRRRRNQSSSKSNNHNNSSCCGNLNMSNHRNNRCKHRSNSSSRSDSSNSGGNVWNIISSDNSTDEVVCSSSKRRMKATNEVQEEDDEKNNDGNVESDEESSSQRPNKKRKKKKTELMKLHESVEDFLGRDMAGWSTIHTARRASSSISDISCLPSLSLLPTFSSSSYPLSSCSTLQSSRTNPPPTTASPSASSTTSSSGSSANPSPASSLRSQICAKTSAASLRRRKTTTSNVGVAAAAVKQNGNKTRRAQSSR